MSGFRDFDSHVIENVHFDNDFFSESALYNDSTSAIDVIQYKTGQSKKAGEVRESENSEYTLLIKASDVNEPEIDDYITLDSESHTYKYSIVLIVGNHGGVFECKTVKQKPKSGNNSRNIKDLMEF